MKFKNVVLMLFTLAAFGWVSLQPVAGVESSFERIVEAPGLSKDQIYDGTKIWIAENFKSGKSVIEYENKDTGTLIGNDVIDDPGTRIGGRKWGKVLFTMRVDIKDQRFRLTFGNIQQDLPARTSMGITLGGGGPEPFTGNLDKLKPELLKFGDQIVTAIWIGKGKSNW